MQVTEQAFATALRETIAWSSRQIDIDNPRWSLRSPDLRPPHDDWEDDNPGFINCPEYIQSVTTTRTRILVDRKFDVHTADHAGRLLLVDYNITNHNEATEIKSNGFFDWADNPPWDLWVCEITDKLGCWIPQEFVDTVRRSMEVECMNMLEWVTDEHRRRGYPDWLPNYKNGGY